MKLGKIYDYRNKEEAKKLIGKKVLATDYICCLEDPKDNLIGIFRGLSNEKKYPFFVAVPSVVYTQYQFIREVIEEEEDDEPKLMTYRQLAEWLARGFGLYKFHVDLYSFITINSNIENRFVEEPIRIRPWGSDEWVKPTVDIYERDCKGIRTIE